MKRRPYPIPSGARVPRPIVQNVLPETDAVKVLQEEIAKLREHNAQQARDNQALRNLLWEHTRDEKYAPESYWRGMTYGT